MWLTLRKFPTMIYHDFACAVSNTFGLLNSLPKGTEIGFKVSLARGFVDAVSDRF